MVKGIILTKSHQVWPPARACWGLGGHNKSGGQNFLFLTNLKILLYRLVQQA